ncbi:hypothetical protein I6G51_12240 [Corynebacterium minutissimum]|uniref:Uncharacterized protein n=1 Tax=Corynebacterium minutissimum TaxID=38301 RepID=A0A7T2XLU4_9CORY|nr:hypothetical protein [Corynebacterium minutissimum]QPS59606.1 hypothetical protein I6G51_12240 [Corynebacterium minutissimum]QQA79604.1 hypothetical protein I6H49_00610 [Corynebacterium minutissimum]
MKSPNLDKKDKPQQTTPPKAVPPELAIQKLHKENKLQPTPNPTGHKKEIGLVRRK